VAGAALVDARNDGCDVVGALRVREEMAAIAEALQVVPASGVRVPDVNESACDRLTARGQDVARKPHLPGCIARLDERGAMRRSGFVERSGGLARRGLILAAGRLRLEVSAAGLGKTGPEVSGAICRSSGVALSWSGPRKKKPASSEPSLHKTSPSSMSAA